MAILKVDIKKYDGAGRIGRIIHNGKELPLPNLFPVINPFGNVISPDKMFKDFGVRAVFTNAYILYRNKEEAEIALEKGIHEYTGFKGLIATDSGAFQYYMYGEKTEVTPEEIEGFQENIGSDFPVILDLPVQPDDPYAKAKAKIDATVERARDNIRRRKNDKCAWFGPIHGAGYPDLVRYHAAIMNNLDFPINAVGGVVKSFNEYIFHTPIEALLNARTVLNTSRIIHLFGAGLPQFFALAVAAGADTMDSAAYILFAKEKRYMTVDGTYRLDELEELPCNCPICSGYTARELRDMFGTKRGRRGSGESDEGLTLLASHNLYVCMAEFKRIREAIRTGTLYELVEKRIAAHPRLVKAYKILPEFTDYIWRRTPVESPSGMLICGEISFVRPHFRKIPQRILQTYRVIGKHELIIVPETDASVYNSPSMKQWIGGYEKLLWKYAENKNERPLLFIASNLLGLVPLDLVEIYPLCQREWELDYHPFPDELTTFYRYIGQSDRTPGIHEEYRNPYGINRLLNSIKLLENNIENIEKIVILKPSTIVNQFGKEVGLTYHILDDLIPMIKVLCRKVNIELNIIKDLKELENTEKDS